MTIRGLHLPTLALVIVVAACAGPATKPPTAGLLENRASAPAVAKPYHKPVRMNGRGAVTDIEVNDLFTLQQSGKALIYDARPAFFYHLGHIPGAFNLPTNRCDEAIASREAEIATALAAGKTIVVYCSGITCPDARTVAIHLSGFGYPVKIFAGGWAAWQEAALPGA